MVEECAFILTTLVGMLQALGPSLPRPPHAVSPATTTNGGSGRGAGGVAGDMSMREAVKQTSYTGERFLVICIVSLTLLAIAYKLTPTIIKSLGMGKKDTLETDKEVELPKVNDILTKSNAQIETNITQDIECQDSRMRKYTTVESDFNTAMPAKEFSPAKPARIATCETLTPATPIRDGAVAGVFYGQLRNDELTTPTKGSTCISPMQKSLEELHMLRNETSPDEHDPGLPFEEKKEEDSTAAVVAVVYPATPPPGFEPPPVNQMDSIDRAQACHRTNLLHVVDSEYMADVENKCSKQILIESNKSSDEIPEYMRGYMLFSGKRSGMEMTAIKRGSIHVPSFNDLNTCVSTGTIAPDFDSLL